MQSKSTNEPDTSNEIFLFERCAGGDLTVVNCFPNDYEVGMASLGYQVIFKLFASNPKTHTFRCFTNWQENIPKKIDLVSFSVSWELDFINIIRMLKDLGIPVLAAKRGPEHPLVYGGGPVLTANPEPWAQFFDFIAIGDSEGSADNIINSALEYKNSDSRSERNLDSFLNIPGIYVPALRAEHPPIERQKSKASELASTPVIAPSSFWDDTFLLEVVRSCPEMCRFCLASYLSLPFRAPDLEGELIPKVREALKYTDSIGLLGASVTQHPEFIDLLKFMVYEAPKLKERCSEESLGSIPKLQVASVRASTVTSEMTDLLAKCGVKNLTIAIESGSQRLRDIINKKLPEEYIFSATKYARESGLKSVKLYGMVGLPYETDEDIDATINLLRQLKEENKTLKITFGCSVFTPKAQTPFQDFGVDSSSEQKLKKITKALKPLGIDVRAESYKLAQVQALISRGDSSLTDYMLKVEKESQFKKLYKQNNDMDKYEYFVFANWQKVYDQPADHYPWKLLLSEKQSSMLKEHARDAASIDQLN